MTLMLISPQFSLSSEGGSYMTLSECICEYKGLISTCRFRYPSIYIVFGEFLITLLIIFYQIASFDEPTFYCPTEDYFDAVDNPTLYCSIAIGEHHCKQN